MAFVTKMGNILKQRVSKHINLEISSPSRPSIFHQAIRCMSSSNLRVEGLPYTSTDESSLRREFAKYGTVVEVKIEGNCWVVSFASSYEASKAIHALDGKLFRGNMLKVKYATGGRSDGSRRYGATASCYAAGLGGGYGSDSDNDNVLGYVKIHDAIFDVGENKSGNASDSSSGNPTVAGGGGSSGDNYTASGKFSNQSCDSHSSDIGGNDHSGSDDNRGGAGGGCGNSSTSSSGFISRTCGDSGSSYSFGSSSPDRDSSSRSFDHDSGSSSYSYGSSSRSSDHDSGSSGGFSDSGSRDHDSGFSNSGSD